MFRIYSGIDQSAHLQRIQVWFEITDRFCAEVSRNSISARLQVHEAAWFIEERNITYVDRRDQFELMKDLQMFEYSGVDTKCPYTSVVPLNWYQYIYYSDAMHHL